MQNKIILAVCFWLATVFCVSCISDKDALLEFAFEFAGNNRIELERVIDYYKDNKEKQEAAKFLISNMPHCYSYKGWQLDSIKPILAYIANTPGVAKMNDSQKATWETLPMHKLKKVYDCHIITADYLIKNIDHAFKVWKERPWNKSLCFDDFCELLLPYRIGDEPLSDWRHVYESQYGKVLDSLYSGCDVIEACHIVEKEIQRNPVKYNVEFAIPHLEAKFLFKNRIGYCRESCDLGIYAMRACGIPVASDFFIVSPDYQHSHQWLVVRDTSGVYLQFGYDDVVAQRNQRQTDGRKKGKVYRSCYAIQPDRVLQSRDVKGMPTAIHNEYIKDVTSEYFGENKVSVPLETKPDNIYLGVFSPQGWQVVDYGLCHGRIATFHNIESGVIYQPLTTDGMGNYVPAGYPFLYKHNKDVRILTPDSGSEEVVSLRRKMSLVKRTKAPLFQGIIGTQIEVAKSIGFSHPVLIHEFRDTLRYRNLKIFHTSDNTEYRYLRYTVTDGNPIILADIAVYEDSLCNKEVPIRLVTLIDSIYKSEHITDHNMMTSFRGPKECRSLIFELVRPSKIGCIDFYPKNDDNFIRPGDIYELLYQNGTYGWKSLGTKKATGETIEFLAPSGALLWLRDKTRGKEEQVFIYENGRQWFVSDI